MYANLDLGEIFIWGTRSICFIGLIPQIIFNFINGSTKGLSNLFLFCFLNFYFSLFLISFLRNLPDAYRFVGFLSLIATIILILQKYFYLKRSNKKQRENILNIFSLNLLFYTFIIIFIHTFSFFIVYVLSIIMFISGLFSLIPQIYKTYKDKDIGNLSLQTFLIMGFGGIIEFCVSIIKFLPLDIILLNSANVLFTIIFLLQYSFYKKMNKIRTQKRNKKVKSKEVFLALIKDSVVFKKNIPDF